MKGYINNSNVIFAFNIWDVNSAKAVLEAACDLRKDVILQTSSSIYNKIDIEAIRYFISYYSKQNTIRAWLHLDHCRNIDIIQDAINKGYDSVMIDASDKSLDNNIEITNKVIEMAHEKKVLVEAELGQIRGVEDEIECDNSSKVKYREIDYFIKNVDVDMLAVAFGNAHGVYKGTPVLDYDIVRYVTENTDIPFVVHGGSGMSDDILKKLISIHGVKKINISTDLKLAYREGIMNSISSGLMEEEGFQSIKIEKEIHNSIMNIAEEKMKLLNRMD